MVVSDQLTWIAEAIVREVVRIAWRHISKRDGELAGTSAEAPGLAVIAYGKFGGIELGYGSDLDLVFLYREDLPETTRKGLPRETFFVRLAQRVIHLLETRTLAGVLYEVDPRLRPRGASGQLAASLSDFAHYQADEAWTWEHQALVRARGVAGDPAALAEFEEIRRDQLAKVRDHAELCREVVEMRCKMRSSLDKTKGVQFDLKQGIGGIADLEFIVQFLVLRDAATAPVLLGWTDNIRILEVLARVGRMTEDEAKALISAYRHLRAAIHQAALQGEVALAPMDEGGRLLDSDLEQARQRVQGAWSAHMLQEAG
jgi:glutamate-ammonia-ligase adenylyltransferase